MLRIFLIFLGLSLPVLAENAELPKTSQQHDKAIEQKPLCDPQEKIKMPETFY